MIDSNSQFYAILTNVGVAKQANANALGIAWKITQMGVGDANGADPQPSATQKTLINEWRRAPLNQLIQDATNPAIIIAEQVIPAEIGGKWIREIGLYDVDGDLVAVANCAPSFKPLLAQGSGRTQVVRMNLIVSNSASVELKIDPAVVLATREFVTSELAKQDFKSSVLVCTTGNIALTGLQTIDGVAVTAGKRVLVAKQTAGKDNGIWVAAAGAWTRAADADKSEKVTPGLLVHVEQGTLYGDSGWQLITDGALSLGVTSLSFEMVWGRTGVTAGTYRSVTVDKNGRVVAATNPTTVAGYGLTDVYTMSQVDAALAALVNSSPAALDTLNELALALGNDPNFAATITNLLAQKAPIASPTLTGVPKAPTAPVGTASTQIATMQAIIDALASVGLGLSAGANNIAAGTDLNTILKSGVYGQGVTANATLELNYPVAKAGTLFVLRGGAVIVTQLYMEFNTGRIWNRGIYNGAPSEWSMGWDTSSLVKTDSPLDTTPGRMLKVGDYGIGNWNGVKVAFTTNNDWSKPAGWSGFIDVTTSKANGCTVPVNAAGVSPTYGIFSILGRRDSNNGYVGMFVDYANGRTWMCHCAVLADGPTWREIYTPLNVSPFIQTLLDDADQTTALATLGVPGLVSGMIQGVTSKNVGGGVNVTLTAAEANVGVLWFTGVLTANISVIVPAGAGMWTVVNRTTGAFTLTLRQGALANPGVVVPQSRQMQVVSNGTTTLSQTNTAFSSAEFSGEVQSLGNNAMRHIQGNYGSFWRNDGASLYLMLTDSGDQYGSYNALRPFAVNLATGKASLASGVNMPTMPPGTNTTDGATCGFVQAALAALVSSSPAALDTLNELALALGNDPNFATTMTNLLGTKAPLASPALTGDPRAPTPATTDNDTSIATTAFVRAVMALFGLGTDTAPLVADANDITLSGLSRLNSDGLNLPIASSSPVTLFTQRFSSTGALQICNVLAFGAGGRMFWRIQAGSTWGAWREVAATDSPAFTGTPTTPTPATNTAGQQVVNQDYVRAWTRKFIGAGVGGLGSAYTVNPNQVGLWFNITTPGAVITLPATDTVPSGSTFLFRNISGNSNATLSSTSTFSAETTGATLILAPYEVVEVAASGGSYVVINRGSMAQGARIDSPAFTGNPTAPTPAQGDNDTSIANTAFVTTAISASENNRVGEVTHFAMSTPPPGYLKRNGAWVSRTAYAALFAKIGTTYGAGDGSTVFALPDSRAEFDRGWDDGRNVDTGRVFGSAQASQNLSHTHTGSAINGGAHNHQTAFVREKIAANMVTEGGNAVFGDEMTDGPQYLTTSDHPGHTHMLMIANSGGNESRPVNTAFLACIKY
ncbi:phage-related tail fiber protein [Pseudomonas sp. GM78]|uniref:phage tail-collar fiber domain-containing protein n=1 Tax=Pseudomonas sp. GM78 TaxID=1144337 RepID=UPI00026F85EC|nr:phage tail protein [Pseudomonas sp. GM78]EJN31772.1 phage-related tail fiber protein [Pseudomonas sp. GM78]